MRAAAITFECKCGFKSTKIRFPFFCKCGRAYQRLDEGQIVQFREPPVSSTSLKPLGSPQEASDTNQLPTPTPVLEAPQGPPISSQGIPLVGGIIRSSKAYAKWALAGFPTRTTEEIEQIKVICSECPFFKDKRCEKCGCYLPAKTRMLTEHCPLDPPKW